MEKGDTNVAGRPKTSLHRHVGEVIFDLAQRTVDLPGEKMQIHCRFGQALVDDRRHRQPHRADHANAISHMTVSRLRAAVA